MTRFLNSCWHDEVFIGDSAPHFDLWCRFCLPLWLQKVKPSFRKSGWQLGQQGGKKRKLQGWMSGDFKRRGTSRITWRLQFYQEQSIYLKKMAVRSSETYTRLFFWTGGPGLSHGRWHVPPCATKSRVSRYSNLWHVVNRCWPYHCTIGPPQKYQCFMQMGGGWLSGKG